MFQESERGALLPLPADRFPFFHEAYRAVHRDGHLEVDKAYYSAPPEYVARRLWVRWDATHGDDKTVKGIAQRVALFGVKERKRLFVGQSAEHEV